MTHDQEREKFEAWYRQEYSFSGKFGVFASGDYVSEHTHKKWHVWQEAWQAAKREPVASEGDKIYQVRKGISEDFEDCHPDTYHDFCHRPELRRIVFTHPQEAMAVTDEMVERGAKALSRQLEDVTKNLSAQITPETIWRDCGQGFMEDSRTVLEAALTTPRGG